MRWEDNPGLSVNQWAVNVSQVLCSRNAEGDFIKGNSGVSRGAVQHSEGCGQDSRKAGRLQPSKDVGDGLSHDFSQEPPDFSP